MKITNSLLASLLLTLPLLNSCTPKEDEKLPEPAASRVFVVNEGLFGSNSGTVSRFDPTAKTVTPDLFQSVNGTGRTLGDVVQNLAVAGGRGYVVVNNSNKIEAVSLPDFRSVGVVRGLHSPRYFLAVSATRGYVTQWGRDTSSVVRNNRRVPIAGVRAGIKIIDLATNAVTDSIATGPLPERLTLAGGRVFVANSGGNTLTVIDPATNRVTATVPVGDAPNSFALDKNARLWVLCGGQVQYSANNTGIDYATTTPGSLYSLDPGNPTAGATARTFASNRLVPTDLQINPIRDQLYFRAIDGFSYLGGVCRLGIADATLPDLSMPFITGLFYGLGIDPSTGVIYAGTGNFAADKFVRHRPDGTKIDEYGAGLGVNGFVFFE